MDGSAAEPAGSRGTVRAFLIADIRGYTTFTRERGDQSAARLATRFADLARDSVEARSGRVIELRGDEALAVFTSSGQAVRAALELQEACRESSADDPELPLPVGIGIDVGEAIPVEDGYRGRALNMAARLCAKAGAGQVLLSAQVVADIDGSKAPVDRGPGIRFEARGSAELKGFEGQVELFEAAPADAAPLAAFPHEAAGSDATAPAPAGEIHPDLEDTTPILGREDEMRWLRGTWRQARRGHGRAVIVSGPTGAGKTRLAGALAAWVGGLGWEVRYTGAGGAGEADALIAIGDARAAVSPSLHILDHLDLFDAAAEALGAALEELSDRTVLVLGLVRSSTDSASVAELAGRLDDRGDGHRVLGPLRLDDVREVVRYHAGDSAVDAPVESILRSSGGLPARVHEAASAWARDEAGRRLAAAAELLAEGRSRQSANLDFANTVIGLQLDRITRAEGQAVPAATCPYKGLAAFDESDAASFFGRERLIGELAARTVGFGLLGLVGPSGSGKSSVVMAGLLPSLAAGLLPGSERWRQARMRPGEHPLRELDAAVGDAGGERLVLAIDQFEELFTATADEDERRTFLDRLVELARAPERAVVVATIRADFLGNCAPYREFAELLAANLVLVGAMTPDELRRAIELPARRSGLRVESSLTQALIADITDEPGALPLLSTALVELWDARSDGWLRLEAHERTGGVRGAVARLAEESFDRLDGPEREAARAILLRLVQGEGDTIARRRAPVAEFEPDRDPARAAVLERFTRDRLLTMSDGTVEVAHEALLSEWPRLREWLAEDAQGRQLRLHLTEASNQWERSGREPGELYRGARLSATLDWSTLHGRELNDLEREFVAASRDASERESQRQRRTNRRLRGLLVGIGAFLVLALVAGSLALVQRGQARRSAEQARAQSARAKREEIDALSQRLGAQALDQKDLPLSLLLSREGVAIHDSVQTRGYLLSALERSPDAVRDFRPLPGRYLSVSAAPDGGEFLVGVTNEEQWALVQTGTGRVIRRGTTVQAALSADGTAIGVVNPNEVQATVLDAATGHVRSRVAMPSRFGPNNLFAGGAWSPDLRTFVFRLNPAVTPNTPSNMYVVDTRTGGVSALPPSPRGPKAAKEAQFSPDGRYLATVALAPSVREFVTIWRTGHSSRPVRILVRPSTDEAPPALAISHDDHLVAVGGEDGSITVYDLRDPSGSGRVFTGRHNGGVNGVAFTPDDRTLVSVGEDQQVLVWDVASRALQQTLDGHSGSVNGPALTSDGRTIFTAGADGSVIEWDLSGTRSLAHRTQIGGGSQFYSQTLVTGDADGTLAASPQDSATAKANVLLLDGPGPTPLRTIPIGAVAVALAPDGGTLAVATHLIDAKGDSIGPRITLWDTSTAHLIADLTGPPMFVRTQGQQYGNDVEALAFSPDGRTVAGIDDHAVIYLWDVASHHVIRTVSATAHPRAFNGGVGVAFSPDGLLAAAYTGAVSTWRLSDAKRLYRVKLDAKPLAFSPDGRLLAAGGGDGTVHLYDATRGAAAGPAISTDAGRLETLAFSPDGRTLAAAGSEGSARLIDVASRTAIGQPLTGGGVDGGAIFWNGGSVLDMVDAGGAMYSWRISSGALEDQACSVAGRNLTRSEWREFLGNRPYRPVCPDRSAGS
jgi:WD40 repeat protein/class 3 adenylate cyclase